MYRSTLTLLFLMLSFIAFPTKANLDWPNLYDSATVPELNVQIRSDDWNTILTDETYDIEVPALFWANQDGFNSAILVSIRRKSATPINGKVSFKIDINEYDGDDPRATNLWHGVKKLSLENGDDVDIVAEAIAWAMHKVAAEQGLYPLGHKPGMANFATLTIHLSDGCVIEPCDFFDLGNVTNTLEPMVYLSVEQPDKTFLKNRNLWVSEETWLYKQDEPGMPAEVKEAGCADERDISPILDALQCAPFSLGREGGSRKKKGGGSEIETCDAPLIDSLIEMNTMLTQGATGAFAANRDDMFGNEHNFYMLDQSAVGNCETTPNPFSVPTRKRRHFPWDLDASLTKVDRSVYGDLQGGGRKVKLTQTSYQNILLRDYSDDNLLWRTQYNKKLLSVTNQSFLNQLYQILDIYESVIGDALEADPNSKVGNAAQHIQNIKNFLNERAQIIRLEVCNDNPNLTAC